ncbi:MAG: TIGR03032 family protein [Cyclobacteriaceae bacterium]|nr:TIGR03032 family protein [Cyclobacteriaceae bacterium]
MEQSKPYPPFSYTFSPNVPELLMQLQASIVISTYQTGKVVVLSPKGEEELIQLPRSFDKPMGMAIKDHKLAIATRSEILVTANSPLVAKTYPDKPDTYDAMFVPRAQYFSGEVDIHDLEWADDKLFAVNTLFSCLVVVDDNCSFRPKWKPHFISALAPEDRCHLNGVAMQENKPMYVTALGKSDEAKGWRANMLKGGIVMDVQSNEIIAENLPVPHTPKIYDGQLYLLLSATGELVRLDVATGKYDVVSSIQGFVRGMDRIGDYLFIAQSKIRQKSSIFNQVPVAKNAVWCGITIVHLPTGAHAGFIKYNASVEELYDVKILKGFLRPNIMNLQKGVHQKALVLPQQLFWNNPEPVNSQSVQVPEPEVKI